MFSKVKPVQQSWSLKFSELSICLLANLSIQFSSSVVSDSATPRTAARQASLFITNSRSLLKLMSIESVMPSYHLILCRPLLLPRFYQFLLAGNKEKVPSGARVLLETGLLQ